MKLAIIIKTIQMMIQSVNQGQSLKLSDTTPPHLFQFSKQQQTTLE